MWESDIRPTRTNDIIEVHLTEDEIEEAKQWGAKLGKLRNSIMKGEHNHFGRLGEMVVAKFVNGTIEDDYQYDVLDPSGKKLEVKTKVTSKKPLPYYDCSVCAHNATQKCDAYVFVRISNTKPIAWILGKKERGDYFKEATYREKGERDPDNGFVFHTNCYNLAISNLDPL